MQLSPYRRTPRWDQPHMLVPFAAKVGFTYSYASGEFRPFRIKDTRTGKEYQESDGEVCVKLLRRLTVNRLTKDEAKRWRLGESLCGKYRGGLCYVQDLRVRPSHTMVACNGSRN